MTFLYAPISFQFHTGSIKTLLLYFLFFVSIKFQFHTGSIKTLPIVLLTAMEEKVSIPHWFNQNKAKFIKNHPEAKSFNSTLVQSKLGITKQFYFFFVSVSIPHWFNQNESAGNTNKKSLESFNSTLVQSKPISLTKKFKI